ncbi:hypothetical protein AO888_02790 [Pseudomonas aeruginosa]|nr:hypothetical protein [Pseudomonas aeruginosa]KSC76899.1 hypothetical protein AO888_02790 [Pseudomonas aeruginosa]
MQTQTEIQAAVFDTPSGNVRGCVTATFPIKGKSKRIAHATLLVDEPPSLYIEVPKTAPLDCLDAMAEGLKAFTAKVREFCPVSAGQEA